MTALLHPALPRHAGLGGVGADAVSDLDRVTLRLCALILAVCLLLPRFGPSSGNLHLNIVGPVGLVLAGWGVWRGVLVLHRRRLLLFGALCCWVLVGGAVRAALPDAYGGTVSYPSLAQFLALTTFATLTFARPLDEARFLRMANACFGAIAVAGLVQFFAQFVGLGLFSFTGLVPDAFLQESAFNTPIPINGTPYFKSNGFFLLEPSMFSQFMALALVIEVLAFRRPRMLLLFGAALMSAVSGTGWLVLGSFVLTVTLSLGLRGVLLAAATVTVGGLALGVLALAAPEIWTTFISRADEFRVIGSSGHLRFVTPWWLTSDILHRTPLVGLFGLGAGVSEHLGRTPNYDYNMNAPSKILLEYGVPALVAYLALLFIGAKTRIQRALVVPSVVLMLVAGGNTQLAPMLFPCLLVYLVADLRPGGPVGT